MVTSDRSVTIQLQGDVEYSQIFSAVTNTLGPGQNVLLTLTTGNNTITVPSSTGVTGACIIPDSSNTLALTLKGVAGDTGIALAKTSPTSLGLAGVSTFVLNAGGGMNVRIIYS